MFVIRVDEKDRVRVRGRDIDSWHALMVLLDADGACDKHKTRDGRLGLDVWTMVEARYAAGDFRLGPTTFRGKAREPLIMSVRL